MQRAAVEDINPADDPNNQGEDEFEEAEQVREENLPDENEEPKQSSQKQENGEMEEHLVVSRCYYRGFKSGHLSSNCLVDAGLVRTHTDGRFASLVGF